MQDSHRAIRTFLRWAVDDGHRIDPRLLRLPRIRIPEREPTVYHITQLRQLLAACSADHPTQEVAVRTLGWTFGASPGHTDSI